MKMMKTLAMGLLLLSSAFVQAEEKKMCNMPAPTPQHEWLKKFVGNWKTVAEIYMEPGKPPVVAKGTDTFRMVGGFWVVGEGKGEMMGQQFASVLTLGYDPKAKEYIGTWIDSMTSHLWEYEGTVDKSGTVLTLRAEGPCPMQPGKTIQFREVTQFVSKDKRIFTSSMKGNDGKWVTMVKVTATRK